MDDNKLKAICDGFKEFLRHCKDHTNNLSLIQPGRFLIPGDVPADDASLAFVPLLKAASYTQGQLENSPKSSCYHKFTANYKKYVKQHVRPFYADFCKNVDRQIVLVDVIDALTGGAEYQDDMTRALANIIDTFSWGKQSNVRRMLGFEPRIGKVAFAATKLDQVVSEDHDPVRDLLSSVVRAAYQRAQYEGIEPICESIAAIRCSKEIIQDGDPGITGKGRDGQNIICVHPRIPSRWPEDDDWQLFCGWKFPPLYPPSGLSARNHDPIPHIRLDRILQALIGDKCL